LNHVGPVSEKETGSNFLGRLEHEDRTFDLQVSIPLESFKKVFISSERGRLAPRAVDETCFSSGGTVLRSAVMKEVSS